MGASSTYRAGYSGGEAKHTLTTSEMPEHFHTIARYAQGSSSGATYIAIATNTVSTSYWGSKISVPNMATNTAGSSSAYNNMPSYLAAYIRKRTV